MAKLETPGTRSRCATVCEGAAPSKQCTSLLTARAKKDSSAAQRSAGHCHFSPSSFCAQPHTKAPSAVRQSRRFSATPSESFSHVRRYVPRGEKASARTLGRGSEKASSPLLRSTTRSASASTTASHLPSGDSSAPGRPDVQTSSIGAQRTASRAAPPAGDCSCALALLLRNRSQLVVLASGMMEAGRQARGAAIAGSVDVVQHTRPGG
mmetsp:Transcript_44025/g.135563  ORF Transcript_44025/g.135563 Transcript_44025/m.135563 type:complete len:209 (-) Transcript_44025:7-633(-)